MTRLDTALDKLEQAIGRLETAYRDSPPSGDGADGGPEMQSLVAAAEGAQRENAALSAEREAIAERLDRVIDSLGRMLEAEDGS